MVELDRWIYSRKAKRSANVHVVRYDGLDGGRTNDASYTTQADKMRDTTDKTTR